MAASSLKPVDDTGPVLVACAHGTRSAAGQETYRALARTIRSATGLRVESAFVDVQEPTVADLVAVLDEAGERIVVVPLLLSSGFHVGVDVAKAVVARHRAIAARHLGPSALLTDVLERRIDALGLEPGAVVLAAAGSSDTAALADTTAAAALLSERLCRPVSVGYGASAGPTVATAVEATRATTTGPVVVASYLLAPGHFHTRLADAGADAVTAPLCSPADIPDELVDLVRRRYLVAADKL